MERILVTGAGGRLGKRIAAELLKQGFFVRAFDRHAQDLRKVFPQEVRAGSMELVEGDLLQIGEKELVQACVGCSVAVHLAALMDYSAPEKQMLLANYVATERLLHACKKARVSKFVFASTTSVYRKAKYLPVDEKHPFTPRNAYGRSKLLAEYAVKKSGLDYVILRPTIIYGPGFEQGFRQVAEMVENGKYRIIGDGNNRVSMLYVQDAVEAFVLAVKALIVGKVKKQDFIIAGEPLTQKEYVMEVARQSRVPAPEKHVAKWLAYFAAWLEGAKAFFARRKPKIYEENVATLCENRYYSTSKARKMLGWKQKTSFKKGLREFLKSIGEAK